ncbi:hypothetical protein RJ639_028489 [Escallonia herrerae]|uniref:J domain-containing protein n=1 Tax=Escallonia herrerae TaxID=1293975 RepID=A0AA88X7Z4_9ASTE|nr:hypothetical protein RJ639_028489 [Escallonia herrerae]
MDQLTLIAMLLQKRCEMQTDITMALWQSLRKSKCQYKVLGLGGDCTADEIRSAYHRLALQRHPDKLAQFGISPATYRWLAFQAYQTSPFP